MSTNGTIYQYNGSGWTQIPGTLSQVSVASDGTVWGVNANGLVYRYSGSAGWTQVSGNFTQIAVGSAGLVWGVNAAGAVSQYTGNDATPWNPSSLPTATSIAAAADGTIVLIDRQGTTQLIKNAASGASAGNRTVKANMTIPRALHTATLLSNGNVLVAGGQSVNNTMATTSAELYDLVKNAWTPTTGPMATARAGHTATLLPNGNVLVAGGTDLNSWYLSSAELYNPSSQTWTATNSIQVPHWGHAAILLPNGKVLVAGGYSADGKDVTSTELYDPSLGTWTATSAMSTHRQEFTATLLSNGKVLVAGGQDNHSNTLTSAELYDPSLGTWSLTGSLKVGRSGYKAARLANGKVLVVGGYPTTGVKDVTSAELYDPSLGTWSDTGGKLTEGLTNFSLKDRIFH